jgi:hypothetical protein
VDTFEDTARDVPDPVRISDGSSTVFLDDEHAQQSVSPRDVTG